MVEQLTLFEDHLDLLTIVTRYFVRRYERCKSRWSDWEGHPNYNDWLLHEFSSYSGGSADEELERCGYWFYNCSPKGIRLETRGRNFGFVPKDKILKTFGIKDDRKDVLKDESDT